MRRFLSVSVVAMVQLHACGTAPPPFDAAREVDRWVTLWEEYDLDRLPEVFVWDTTLTYLSSEREGLLLGADAVREHHRTMGFTEGGQAPTQALWVQDVHATELGSVTVVTAVWLFGDRGEPADEWQRGPMTAVYRRDGDAWRIVHMHFADYER